MSVLIGILINPELREQGLLPDCLAALTDAVKVTPHLVFDLYICFMAPIIAISDVFPFITAPSAFRNLYTGTGTRRAIITAAEHLKTDYTWFVAPGARVSAGHWAAMWAELAKAPVAAVPHAVPVFDAQDSCLYSTTPIFIKTAPQMRPQLWHIRQLSSQEPIVTVSALPSGCLAAHTATASKIAATEAEAPDQFAGTTLLGEAASWFSAAVQLGTSIRVILSAGEVPIMALAFPSPEQPIAEISVVDFEKVGVLDLAAAAE